MEGARDLRQQSRRWQQRAHANHLRKRPERLSQLLHLNQAPSAPSQPEPPAPEPAPKQANGKRARRARQAAQQAEVEPARQEGLPEFARDNPWLPILARAKQS